MQLNKQKESHFANLPSISKPRSRFNMPHDLKTSFNVGELVILDCVPVLPGDTMKMKSVSLVRLTTLFAPIMDNMYLELYWFFVPSRILWEHWVNFLGENDTTYWTEPTTYQVPQITAPSGGWSVGTLADYLGVPTGIDNISIDALPFRAYCKIVNDWFINENLQTPCNNNINDTTETGSNGNNYVLDCIKGGKPFIINKQKDYFTSALPSPQKGASVPLPLGDKAPVLFNNNVSNFVGKVDNNNKIKFAALGNDNKWGAPGVGANRPLYVTYSDDSLGYDPLDSESNAMNRVIIDNAFADLSTATASTINNLRLAFQIQKILERDARGGTRYFEQLVSRFGVISPDARLQRSEYLGGSRSDIQVNQVIQTSGSVSGQTPQGTQTAYSISVHSHKDFIKSFVEYGYVMCLGAVRYYHSYNQGIPKYLSRKNRYDYYDPLLANIGEQPILNKEIYAQGNSVVDSDGNIIDDQVFGYNEAFADYRFIPNKITGEMRTTYAQSLDIWHLADNYSSLPLLGSSWIKEDKSNVDRVITVQSSNSNQFIGNFYFNMEMWRTMPLYSIPGLIDH